MEMGRRAIPCPMGLPNYTSKVHKRDAFLYDLWGRGCYPFRNQIPHIEIKFLHSKQNDELLEKSLDLIKERRENAMVQLAYYQNKLKQRYDANIKLRPLTVGDLVLRKVLGTVRNPA